ncbi:MAG: Co2+/Mg2+ efflux protein ApaG [Sphingomonadales bacterium]
MSQGKNQDTLPYGATSHGVTVEVRPYYLPDQSDPETDRHVWGYHIRISNHAPEPVQLRRRYWRITDGRGQVHEVRGEGVVGEQPLLASGEYFEYDSGVPLTTASGFMTGHYEMERADGAALIVEIPTFSLDAPDARQRVH